MEQTVDFSDINNWVSFWQSNYQSLGGDKPNEIGDRIRRAGFIEPLTFSVALPYQIELGSSWREGLFFNGISSRVRAVMLECHKVISAQNLDSPRIYAAEAVTTLALRLRGMYPRFIGSEFSLEKEKARLALSYTRGGYHRSIFRFRKVRYRIDQ